MAAGNKRQTAIFAVSLDAKPSTCAENYQQFRCTLCLEFGAVTLNTEARTSDMLSQKHKRPKLNAVTSCRLAYHINVAHSPDRLQARLNSDA